MWRILALSCLLAVTACAVFVEPRRSIDPAFSEPLAVALQETLNKERRTQKPASISASLYLSERCHWAGTTGLTRPLPGVTMQADTLYGFASITKTFVAAIVLQLVEENRLTLDDPLGKWLEEYPNVDPEITIRQLLNHGSGLYNYTENSDYWAALAENPDRFWSPQDVLGYVKEPPNTGFSAPIYSNTNYTLLGMIVEAVTQNSLQQELESRITLPLKLHNTYLATGDFKRARWADTTGLSNAEYSSAWAAGALASTAKEIAQWGHTLYSGNFLQPESQDAMFSTVVRRSSSGYGLSAGLGVFEYRIGSYTGWGHDGSIPPFRSQMFYVPELGLSVAYSSSLSAGSQLDELGARLLRSYLDHRPDDVSACFES